MDIVHKQNSPTPNPFHWETPTIALSISLALLVHLLSVIDLSPSDLFHLGELVLLLPLL
jgi:hypothetical protein